MQKYPSRILYQGAINTKDTKEFGFVCDANPLNDVVFLFINPTLTEQDLMEALEWRERYLDRFLAKNNEKTREELQEIIDGYRKDPEKILGEIRIWKIKNEVKSEDKSLVGSIESLRMNNDLGKTSVPVEEILEKRSSFFQEVLSGNVPELSATDEFSTTIRGVIDSLPEDEKVILSYMPHLFLVGYNLSYFYDVSNPEEVGKRGLNGAVGAHIFSSNAIQHQDYYAADMPIYHTIYIGEITRETIVEETTHAINAHVGFSKEKWQNAAIKDFKNSESKVFISKGDLWMDHPSYNDLIGSETLQELCGLYNEEAAKGLAREKILQEITDKMPNCARLFAEYKAKEQMLANAYSAQDFNRAEEIRSGKIMPDTSLLLPRVENLAHARKQNITITTNLTSNRPTP